ncbi:site-specific integrase [Bradyrhizobium diazoefficiens]
MKKADVTEREDGYWFVIGEGKTEAAQREIPVHPTAAKIIERRLKGEDEWLFEGLTPGGPDEKRSWYVSKAFGRFRAQDDVKVDGRLEDFHALRNTFIELMEGLEVAESTVKLLVGHKRTSMTYGHYSKGQRVNLREAIKKVDYGVEIMGSMES